MQTRKAFKFRIHPTKAQATSFGLCLNICRELYNAALQERRDAYRMCGKSITYYDQANQLPAIKEVRPDVKQVYSQVLQDVLRRADKAMKAFFDRCKKGQTPGFPRFKAYHRYNSFCYPQSGWSLTNNKLYLSGIGTVRVNLHRTPIGKVKTVTISRDSVGQWWVCFSVEYEFEQPVHTGEAIGIDLGLENFANLSNGEQVANPHFFRQSEKQLAKTQRKLAKVKKLCRQDPQKIKAKKAVARAHLKVKNQRQDFAHQLSRKLANTYSLVAMEDLNVKGLAGGMLAKSVNDAAWSQFTQMLEFKVVETGAQVVKVDPRQTSQICPKCAAISKKALSVRWHSCPCGCEMHRDIAAALVIFSRGLATVGNQPIDAPAFWHGV